MDDSTKAAIKVGVIALILIGILLATLAYFKPNTEATGGHSHGDGNYHQH